MRSRACDPCAARKAKCDRQSPCQRCRAHSLSCTILRRHSKPGPKGPWSTKNGSSHRRQRIPGETRTTDPNRTTDISRSGIGNPPLRTRTDINDNQLLRDSLPHYLFIYAQEFYSLWPVINLEDMSTRLLDTADVSAYALCTAISAVTLQRVVRHGALNERRENTQREVECERLAAESKKARISLVYRQRPEIDVLLSSFFLHIYCANRGQICEATLLLREAITLAQLLGLDQAKHYPHLPDGEAQLHLRTIWMLHITERGHTTRFDFPRILHLDPSLPTLQATENTSSLLPFRNMCRLFQNFGHAMDGLLPDRIYDFFHDMDICLRDTQEPLPSSPELQRVDFLITKQWMRMILWKRAIYHVDLSDKVEGSLSISFPEEVARMAAAYINSFSREIVESHGLGMQMKLAEIAISVADMLSCMPHISEQYQLMRIGAAGILDYLAAFLFSISNNVNPRLELLREKISGKAWSFPLEYPLERDDDDDDDDAAGTCPLKKRNLMANTRTINTGLMQMAEGKL